MKVDMKSFMVFFLCSCTTAILFLSSPAAALTPRPPRSSYYIARQFLVPHNIARAAIRLPPLVWDNRVASYAAQYATLRKRDCALVHSGGPYGENIFWGSGTGWTPAQAVAAWTAEKKWYKYKWNTCTPGQMCGHYTQIVWKTSRRLGCASVNCDNGGGQFIVCSYDPPGNWFGEKPY